MVERKLFKTKLCVLYKRGHCPRQSCSFAHGDAELRRFSGSFSARRDYRAGDLRDKLERRHSPLRRYSPRRDTRGRHVFRGFSPSRSPRRNSDPKRKKKEHLDDLSDYSSSLRLSDGTEGRPKRQKKTSSDSRYILEEQLKQVQLDVDKREDHKCQLQISLEERIQEADILASRIQELESQLHNEKEYCYRVASKIKKFVRAHNRHLRMQDELKRSQTRLQKLADQLGSDAGRLGANGDDLSINIVSDGEPIGTSALDPRNELQGNGSPHKKKVHSGMGAAEEPKAAKLTEGMMIGAMRSEKKSSRWNVRHVQSNENKETELLNQENSEGKYKQGNNPFIAIPPTDKAKDVESGPDLPPTGMAAHAGDEYIDVVEGDERLEIVENGGDAEIPHRSLPVPPPPPVPQNAYSQLKGEDQNVDVEGLEEDMTEVDIV